MMTSNDPPAKPHANCRTALLLGGGGARAAYQVGVLKAVAEIVPEASPNPFPIICGTSAGSINTVALASNAGEFHLGVARIIEVWSNFRLAKVFYVDTKHLLKRSFGWFWSHFFGKWYAGPSSLLDNQPLRELLGKYISFERIENSFKSGDLHAYCLTACSYTTGESTTFFDGNPDIIDWQRVHRLGRRSKMSIDHLMASSAIPVVFPSVKIDSEFFGDGSMRQISPISPAIHLGAEKILIIGLRAEALLGTREPAEFSPSLGEISGYVLDTLFLNSLYADVARMERVNRLLSDNQTADERLKVIEHLIISPSRDIADIAIKHFKKLPKNFRVALTLLGLNRGNSRRFISYLMFTEDFCRDLIELGYQDAMAQQQQLRKFLQCES
ncbi:MAG: patatin-like phospholipase family protein [Gammaproteobacteria bacterium]|nr:patatin-like phospholipase family protein [Gammaproteobacteria bacterium]